MGCRYKIQDGMTLVDCVRAEGHHLLAASHEAAHETSYGLQWMDDSELPPPEPTPELQASVELAAEAAPKTEAVKPKLRRR